ncbi:MAG: hypothetical protein GXY61_09495 [Lentisphaerae bacterium]|nr:hypothetical protein [Lentisphaerota bacterium]
MKTKAKSMYADLFAEFKHLPFLFIGAGISRRYLGLPNWKGLLRQFAEKVYPDNPLALEVFSRSEEGLNWPEVSSRIEQEFNNVWLTNKAYRRDREFFQDQVKQGVSPFKLAVARFFSEAEKQTADGHLLDELSCLTNVGKRSIAGVITTNYDQLIEEVFSGYKVFVGQEQLLFSEPQGIAEVYKIHGCCTQPESIVINEKDYEAFNKRNAYLAAKLLTVFMEHPIIFLGYSISDPNVQAILKAIADCLSQENLRRLKKRFIFIEYSDSPLEVPIIREHTINFDGAGRSLEMTRVELHDYLPLYSELLSRRYEYNPKLLRQLKRDIYQMITTNEPVDRFQVIDIEDDQLENVKVLAGVGIKQESGPNGESGHHIPNTAVLFRDVVFDDGEFDLKSLVEEALGHLLKHNSYSLPLHKYISAYEKEFGEKAPSDVSNHAKHSIDEFLSQGLKTRRNSHPINSFEELKKLSESDEKVIESIPLLTNLEACEGELQGFLSSYMEKNPTALTESGQVLKTNLKRVIKIYDWLKYGKEKGAPIT